MKNASRRPQGQTVEGRRRRQQATTSTTQKRVKWTSDSTRGRQVDDQTSTDDWWSAPTRARRKAQPIPLKLVPDDEADTDKVKATRHLGNECNALAAKADATAKNGVRCGPGLGLRSGRE